MIGAAEHRPDAGAQLPKLEGLTDKVIGAKLKADLLFADQTMPGMAGDQLAEALRVIRPDLPVIICSGYGARVGEARLREIGAVALLSKPITTATLARVVMEGLEVNHMDAPVQLKIVAWRSAVCNPLGRTS